MIMSMPSTTEFGDVLEGLISNDCACLEVDWLEDVDKD